MNSTGTRRIPRLLTAVIASAAVGLIAFSQTGICDVNEGFELLAAQLINTGKYPYLDFFYQHTPLYAYSSACWMRVFGETWRAAHAFSAILTVGCTALVATYVFSRLCNTRWGLAAAVCAALFQGLNVLTIQFGTIAEAYAICSLLNIAAFRLALGSVEGSPTWFPLLSGLCAGFSAASSLLVTPVVFVLLIWIVWNTPPSHRLRACASFLFGVAVPFLTLLGLNAHGLRQVLFDTIEYQLFYRSLNWEPQRLNQLDLRVVTSWLSSTQGLLLVGLMLLALLSVAERHRWDPRRKAELQLCTWLMVALGTFLAITRPTFVQYFVLVVPFLSILASAGVYEIGSRIGPSMRPLWLALGVSGLFLFQSARLIHAKPWLNVGWRTFESIAAQVNSSMSSDGVLYVDDDRIYFAARRTPLPGLENVYAASLRLPEGSATLLHVVSQPRIDEWLAAGHFDTVSILANDPRLESLNLVRTYGQRKDIEGRVIFWRKAPSGN